MHPLTTVNRSGGRRSNLALQRPLAEFGAVVIARLPRLHSEPAGLLVYTTTHRARSVARAFASALEEETTLPIYRAISAILASLNEANVHDRFSAC